MPSLNFVLPHWLYWGTLICFPFIAMYLVARQRERGAPRGVSLFIAYLFWLCAGLMGLHRFYLKNYWGFAFIPVFLLILFTTSEIRDLREDVSRTRAAVESLTGRTRPSKAAYRWICDAGDDRSIEQSDGRRSERQSRFRESLKMSSTGGTATQVGSLI